MKTDEKSTTVVSPIKEDAQAPAATEAPEAAATTPTRRKQRFAKLWQALSAGVGVWIGLFIAAAGFGLIAFTWSKVAALVNVALQLPYMLSGGFVGLGLVMLGLLVVNLAVKRREAFDRHRQLEEVREALVRLREAIEGPGEGGGEREGEDEGE